jgi:hypothetical protein
VPLSTAALSLGACACVVCPIGRNRCSHIVCTLAPPPLHPFVQPTGVSVRAHQGTRVVYLNTQKTANALDFKTLRAIRKHLVEVSAGPSGHLPCVWGCG